VDDAGRLPVKVVTARPDRGRPVHYLTLLSAFANAESRIYITCGYFVPDPQLLEVLEQAARRGVDVRLMLPSFSDFWAPLAAGRSHYARLLDAGVRVFERKGALLHAKTAVVDGVWSTVGSTNLDFRSFVHNEEANVIVFDDAFAGELERLFARDLQVAEEVTAERWSQRGLAPRLQQWFARQFDYFL
jgi:cardiolipin synthase